MSSSDSTSVCAFSAIESLRFTRSASKHLIVIDGDDVMTTFNDMGVDGGEKPKGALILLPLATGLLKAGYKVRIMLKRLVAERDLSDSYVLNHFIAKGLVQYPPETVTSDSDYDVFVAQYCYKLHARFISNKVLDSAFMKERGFGKRLIRYDKVEDDFFPTILTQKLEFKFKIRLGDFQAFDRGISDEVEQELQKIADFDDYNSINLLYKFVHNYWCYVYGFDSPDDIDDFPMSFKDFAERFEC